VVGEHREVAQLGRGEHAGFVDENGRAGGKSVPGFWESSPDRVLGDELVDGVGLDAGLLSEDLGCGG
jgi:hypothetical protein